MWYYQKGRGKHGHGLESWGGMWPISATFAQGQGQHTVAHLAYILISSPCTLFLVYHGMSTAGLLTNNTKHTILSTSAFGKPFKNLLLGGKSRGKLFPKVAFKYLLSSATQGWHKGCLLPYQETKRGFSLQPNTVICLSYTQTGRKTRTPNSSRSVVDGGFLWRPSPPWGTTGYWQMLEDGGLIVTSSVTGTKECTPRMDSSTPMLTWIVLVKVSGSQNKKIRM